jgi:hypothetical protein
MTSSQRERSSPSPSALCGHPRHCSIRAGTVTTSSMLLERTGMRRRHTRHCTSYDLPLTPPSSRSAGGDRTANLYAATLEVAPVRAQGSPRRLNRSEIRWDGRQPRNTARHTSTHKQNSAARLKLPSLWPIKGGAIPPPQGDGRDDRHTYTPFAAHHDIRTRLNQYLWDLEDQPPVLPRL